MSPSFDFDEPDHFTTGAVGGPGARVFYLQAGEGGRVVTLKAEKEQVRALGEYLAGLLAQLAPAPEKVDDTTELLEPVDAAWAVGSIGLGYDEARARVIVVANEEVEEDSGVEPATARFHITRAQAAAFVERASTLMKAGRPACPMCSQPMDASGHVCPRSNGHVTH
ncbi:MAG TPA: DUF3090 family protein [Candidatus Limnocylindria bacterium]|nr:DUF3090 family protein [Candidatus Limnocylindria bacterium]